MNYNRETFFHESTIRYMDILKTDEAGIGIFFFPSGMGFPIHDHFDMFVGTKILDGTLITTPYTADDY